MSERTVTIYGIREIGATTILYVGASTHLGARRFGGYSQRVRRVIERISWEYVDLEVTNIDDAPTKELFWIEKLRAEGHRLLNVNKPAKKHRALPVAPRRSGPDTRTDDDREKRGFGRLTLRMRQAAIDTLSNAAAKRGCSRVELIEAMIAKLSS